MHIVLPGSKLGEKKKNGPIRDTVYHSISLLPPLSSSNDGGHGQVVGTYAEPILSCSY